MSVLPRAFTCLYCGLPTANSMPLRPAEELDQNVPCCRTCQEEAEKLIAKLHQNRDVAEGVYDP